MRPPGLEAATGKEIARMTHAGRVWSWALAFSPDGKYVVSGSADRTARVWGAATGKEVARMTHDGEVKSVAFSPDGKYVVSEVMITPLRARA
jgi:WD40 repeat protein